MRIKRLRLTGFKSFVDPADLRIEPGLTGVVGPNGCGKSNLLEALRWVMGETSARSMRGAGMDDVIFAGTQARPARDFAEVSVLADQMIDVGGAQAEEFEVVRRIERGAGSAYRINGRDVRAKDVALAFADAATGAHSPALVSQGRIGAIIAAKPAERRAMLEEAAGIAGLHVRRKDAEAKLRATETNLARLDEVITDQEARAGQLKRQARQAERYRLLSSQIRVAEGRMIFARWRDAAAAADTAKAESRAAEALVAERAAAVAQTSAARDAATRALGDARTAALVARDRASEVGHALSALRAQKAAAERRLSELDEQMARLRDDRAREGALAHDAAEAIARLTAEGRTLDARITDAAARLPQIDAHLADAERAARDADVALAQALAAQAGEAAEARVAAAARDAARGRAERVRRDVALLDRDRAGLADAAPIAAERDRAVAARVEAAAHGAAARASLEAAIAAERTAQDGRDAAQAARSAAHAELTAIDGEMRALAKAVQPSPRDRLLDRVRPAPGYERALAAALGDDLNAGLDTAAERRWAGAAPQPGDPGPPADTTPLADHVAAPPALARRLAQVFVSDTDAGQPLAVGQRLVTRAGELRRWDGYVARSDGAAAAERLERVNRLRALTATRPAAEAAVSVADATLGGIDTAVTQARSDAAAARRTIDAAELATREATRAEDRAAATLERLAAQRGDLDARATRLADDLREAEADLARAETLVAALPDGNETRARVAALGSVADAARGAVATARADRAGIDRDAASARERAAAAAAEAKGWKARAGEAARRIADMATRESALAEERTGLAARPGLLSERIAGADREATTARAEADSLAAAERAAEATLRTAESNARVAAEALSVAREARAGAVARAENQDLRRVEMGRLSGERFECPPPLLPERAGFDAGEVGSPADESIRHERLTQDRERIGPVNLVAESELAELEAGALTNAQERHELALAVNRLRGSIGTLNREGRERLRAAFEAVDGHFRRLFTTLFNADGKDGGQAHLALVDSDDPLEAGLEILAQPPGKRLQSLTLLSGGEQALTAVALIFALFLTNPAPICVLDEVDAPLDDANIDRFCDLLDRMVQETDTRYLIVTHNAATMSRMHRLFGVTMVEKGVSRLVSVDLGGAEGLLAAE
ncbi:chromosome segregation protein [Sphingomonas sp. Leaf33]|uniref:chromosome segregation protein SMC n=1 Tax=Sphingomonas sp. Leaf33 TaxID=1736215 RepID=UPI0006F55D2D|nr:chromosome segregation protein SMC [Sphingomonas sp. Leaf33]KQN24903.1 chromosome segregation protein [Sphingomonas sp. Leaf33]